MIEDNGDPLNPASRAYHGPEYDSPLEVLAARTRDEPFFCGYWLARSKVATIDPEDLALLYLCRAPRPESWAHDLDVIAAYTDCDRTALEHALRLGGLRREGPAGG